jgi:hypothetical protein
MIEDPDLSSSPRAVARHGCNQVRSNPMSIKRRLLSFSRNAKSYAKRTVAKVGRNERNADIYLCSILQDGKILSDANDAASYIELLRACIEPTALRVAIVKSSKSLGDAHGNRFKTLVETIQSSLLVTTPSSNGTRTRGGSRSVTGNDCGDRLGELLGGRRRCAFWGIFIIRS